MTIERTCGACLKPLDESEYDCYNCDCCVRQFCSSKCRNWEPVKNTFPNCCPGVYWCQVCKKEYLDFAKGHIFVPVSHIANEDTVKYTGIGHWIMYGKCTKCSMWQHEFKSGTDIKSQYEGQPCGERIRDFPPIIIKKEPYIGKTCIYECAYWGPCKQESGDLDFCVHHVGVICSGCKKPAVRECEATLGALCCGRPLCLTCYHKDDWKFKHGPEEKIKQENIISRIYNKIIKLIF
jgi:hypothetical protein